jgi:hypothetical protein
MVRRRGAHALANVAEDTIADRSSVQEPVVFHAVIDGIMRSPLNHKRIPKTQSARRQGE